MRLFNIRETLFALLLIFFANSSFSQNEVTIKVIQTSDVHGAIFPFDFVNNRAVDFGLAQVYSYVAHERANENQRVLLLDNGDILQGQPTVYYANYIDSLEQHLLASVMNFMGYDAGTVGNHDIEVGPKIYNRLVNEFDFPWLSANTINTSTQQPYFVPYTTFNVEGVKVAVLGLTTPAIPSWLPKTLWPEMRFDDMISTAQMWMDTIKKRENPDVVLGLFHAGHNANYEGSDPNLPGNENASLLVAKQVKGFDAVFIGHDHDRVVKTIINNFGDSVLVLDPGSSARMVSELTINLIVDNNGTVTSKTKSGQLVSMRDYIPHPDYVSTFSDFAEKVSAYVDRRIGNFLEGSNVRDSYFGPSSFINIIHSVQLGISNADISFAAPLSFDARIQQGPVFVRDMFKLYAYENLLYIMNLKGSEIKNYLEYSYGLWFNTMKNKDDNLLLFREDEKGNIDLDRRNRAHLKSSFFNFDAAAGIKYQVDVSKPVGQRISIISMENGEPFNPEKVYKVAINSYRGTGGGGHLTEGAKIPKEELKDRIVSVSQMDMRHYLIKWIEHIGNVQPETPNNWSVVPTDWKDAAMQRDKNLLFGSDNDLVYL